MKQLSVAVGLAVLAACGQETTEEIQAPIASTTIVSLTFDDTLADQVQVGELAAARGIRVTFYINSPRLGTSGYMTEAQVIALEQQGHEIAGHTLTHQNLPTLLDADARDQVCNDRVGLLAHGFRVTSFAYPFGADNSTDWGIVRDCGYNSARDVGGLKSAGACPGCPWTNPMTPTNLYEIRTNDSIHQDTSLQTLEQYVTDTENNGGGYVPIVFHHVCDGCNPDSITAANLATFLDWLQARSPTTQVRTIDQQIGGAVQPPVPYSNLVHNPSLETDANGDQVPDCWQRGGYGTSSASYSLVSDAFDGGVAQRIDVTSLSSGGRRLVTAQDSGACAPAVTAGHRYTVTAQYKASVAPKFTAYYRNASGQWVYLGESSSLPTSSTYRQASYTTPAMPTGATAMSVGLTIYAVGNITMDTFQIFDADAPVPGDTAPPSISIACNGGPCTARGYSGPVSVTLAGWDFSGIRDIRYTTDGTDPATAGAVYTGAFTVSATTTVRALGTDNAGNTRALTRAITIASADTTPPTLSIACNGTSCASTPYSGPVSVSLAASDASGIRDIRYTTDGSDPATGTVYTGAFTVSSTTTVRALATDSAGNTAALSQTVQIASADTTPPTLSIACNGSACTGTYSAPVTVTLTATDASGISQVRYTTNGSDPATSGTAYTGPFTLSSTATVRAIATDNAGNTTSASQTVQISTADTTPPTLTIACNGTSCSSSAYTAPVSVTLSASDASGISQVRYTTDGSDPATSGVAYAGEFTVASTTTVRAIATDNAGNATSLSQTITITSGPVNLLANASLETDANGDQVPDCWQRGGFGTNSATFTLVSDAFDGTRAQNVTITSFTSGARRLVSAQDAGACAPRATPGRTYTMTVHYKANVQPKFSVYYRNASGSWVWFAESASLPTAASYTQATYTTPAMPSGATAISIGLSIFNTGSLTTDAYSLVEN